MKESRVLFQLNKLNKLIGREFIGSCNLNKDIVPPTASQMQIMNYLVVHQNEEVFQRDLENVLNLRRATVSGVLQTMERHNLINRVVSNGDARVKKIILTDESMNVYNIAKEKFFILDEVVKSNISEEEIEAFVNTLLKMQDNIIKYGNKK